MQHLFTPWRRDYVQGKVKADGCVFCRIAQLPPAEYEHEIARSSHTFAILNRYPYAYGHTMVIPYAHIASPEELSPAALSDLMLMSNRSMTVLRAIADPPAFNIGANIGAAAGAGIAAHFHFHIVPRWNGDASFMTTIGETRTIADTLHSIARQMRAAWADIYGAPDSNGQAPATSLD